MAAVAVGEFGNEKIVADQQSRDHRSGRNVERFVGERPHRDGDGTGVDDRANDFTGRAGFLLRHQEFRITC